MKEQDDNGADPKGETPADSAGAAKGEKAKAARVKAGGTGRSPTTRARGKRGSRRGRPRATSVEGVVRLFGDKAVDWRVLAVGAVMIVALSAVRLHTFTEPLGGEELEIGLTVKDWQMDGVRRLTWGNEHRPVGAYLCYRVVFEVFGYSEAAVRLLGWAAAALTGILILVWLMPRAGPGAMVLGMVSWAAVSGLPALTATATNVELLMLPLLVGALVMLELFLAKQKEIYFYLTVGLIGVALLFSPVVAVFLLVPYVAVGQAVWRDAWVRMLQRVVSGVALVLCIYLLVHSLCGYDLHEFEEVLEGMLARLINWDTAWLFVLFKHLFSGWGSGVREVLWPCKAVLPLLPLVVLGVGGVVWRIWKRGERRWLPMGWFGVASLMAVCQPEMNAMWLYILLTPWLVMGVVVGCEALPKKWAVIALRGVTVWLVAVVCWTNLRHSPEQVSVVTWGNDWFVNDRVIGQELKTWGMTDMRMYVNFNHGACFYAGGYRQHRFNWDDTTGRWDGKEYVVDRADFPEVLVFMNGHPTVLGFGRRYPPRPYWERPNRLDIGIGPWLEEHYEEMPSIGETDVFLIKVE